MSESESDDPLEELLSDAEEQREKFNEARERLQKVREKLTGMVGTLESEGTIDSSEADRIRNIIKEGNYSKARDAIRDAREGELEFEDEEKEAFARRFSESWDEMSETAERVATALLDFDRDMDREDMVAYLYGKHSSLNKGDIRAVFGAFDEVPEGGLSTRQTARLLAAFNHELNIEPTTKVLDAIKDESDR